MEASLRDETAALARLAQGDTASDGDVGRALARLASACVDCHSVYLYGSTEESTRRPLSFSGAYGVMQDDARR